MIENRNSVVGGFAEKSDRQRLKAPPGGLEAGGTDLSKTVEECLKRLHFHCRCAGVQVRTALSLDLQPVALGAEEVGNVVTELILQSIKHAESGDAIQVTTFQTDGRDPRLGNLPPELVNCLRLAVVEVRGISGSHMKLATCSQAVFQTESDRVCFVFPV